VTQSEVEEERDEYQRWIRTIVELIDDIHEGPVCFWCGWSPNHDDGCPDERLREIAKGAP
jgi:hypothetical protein